MKYYIQMSSRTSETKEYFKRIFQTMQRCPGDIGILNEYKIYKNMLNNLIDEAKTDYYKRKYRILLTVSNICGHS